MMDRTSLWPARTVLRAGALLLALTWSAGSPPPAIAAEPTYCDGAILTGTHESVVVRSGICTISDATVTGNVTVNPGTIGIILRSSVGGDVTAGRHASVAVRYSSVGGSVRATGASGTGTFQATIAGDVVHTDGGDVIIAESRIGGTVLIERNNGGELNVGSTTIGQDIVFADNTLRPGGAQGFFKVNNNTVGRDVEFLRNSGPSGLLTNNVGRNVEFLYNSGASTILDNHAGKHLVCRYNDPAPVVAGNTAQNSKGQCRDKKAT